MSHFIRLVALLLLFASAASAQERFGLEHIGEIVQLSDPQISPDGRSVALIVSRADFEENRRDVELVLVDLWTGEQKVMTRRSVAQPDWSPSGSSLAFLSAVEGRRQLFVLPVGGGEATQITDAPTGVRSYSWRPDGDAFVYVSEEEPEMREGAERHNRSFEADVNYLLTEASRSRHLWLAPAGGGEAERLTSGEWSVGSALADGRSIAPSWSPDGQAIAFAQQPEPGPRHIYDNSIRIVDASTGAIRPLNSTSHRLRGGAAFSPDGSLVSYSFPHEGDTRFVDEVYIAPAEGGDGRSLTHALDRNIRTARWMPDGHSLLILANDTTTAGSVDSAARGQRSPHRYGQRRSFVEPVGLPLRPDRDARQ